MPRKIENRAYLINQLRQMAGNKKVMPSLRIRCLDRIALMEKFYEITLSDQYGPNFSRGSVKSEADEKVEQMLKQLGGDSAQLPPGTSTGR